MPANATTMLATYTRLPSPSQLGVSEPAVYGICELRPLASHQNPKAMTSAVGTAVPTTVRMPTQCAVRAAPAKAARVVPQKITSMIVTRKALYDESDGSKTYAVVVARKSSTVGNHATFSDQSHHTAR